MPKTCKTCDTTKSFKEFERVGKKYRDECRECINMQKIGLNPNPPEFVKPKTQIEDRKTEEAARAIRQQRYRMLMNRSQS